MVIGHEDADEATERDQLHQGDGTGDPERHAILENTDAAEAEDDGRRHSREQDRESSDSHTGSPCARTNWVAVRARSVAPGSGPVAVVMSTMS